MDRKVKACAFVAVSAALTGSLPVYSAGADVLDEIVVTARKRDESILNVPVVETAIPREELEKLQISDINDLPQLAPGLMVGHALLAVGTLISIRGVGTSALDPGVDSSTSVTIDGLSLSQGLALNSATFDLQQIEVLKGPQALFYGKSSPAGVIALRTADPTDKFEVMARAAYEFESINPRGEFVISGPVTDSLKLRLATMYSSAKGYFYNEPTPIAALGAAEPSGSRAPNSSSAIVRGTLLWNPVDQFNARLKVNYVWDRSNNSEAAQLASCPGGIAGIPGIPQFVSSRENCSLDRDIAIVSYNPSVYPGILNGGDPFLSTSQGYGSLELNYRPTPTLTVTSTTGVYRLLMTGLVNTYETSAAPPVIAAQNHFFRHEATEELRINSDFAFPVNFTAGGFYQDAQLYDRVGILGNALLGLPAQLVDSASILDVKTFSGFGQARWKIIPQVELAVGARWTDEKRPFRAFSYLSDTGIPVIRPRLHADNTSPEVTLTYKPKDNITVFGAYKQAYKSGSYSISTPPNPGVDNSFGDEEVKGYEVGLKSSLLDRQLLFNAAWYDYRYYGLQTAAGTIIDNLPVLHTINAGSARSYGVDLDAAYRPRIVEGLQLKAAVNWNRARYLTLNNATCYTTQTIAEGCNRLPDPGTGLFTVQDLSGTPLERAPEWQSTLGLSYDMPLASGYKLSFTNSNQISSKYVTVLAQNRPHNDQYQTSFAKIDLSVALASPNNMWEVALIGKDINDKVTSAECSIGGYNVTNLPLSITGGATSGPAGTGQNECFSDAGRQLWLRLTYRPFGN